MTVNAVLSALLQVIAARQPPPGTTLNPSAKGSGVTLSGGNLAASGVATNNVLGTTSLASGLAYFEVTINSGAGGNALGIGVGNASTPLSGTGLAFDSSHDAICYYDSLGGAFFDGGSIGSAPDFTNSQVVCIAVDFNTQMIWMRNFTSSPTVWNSSSSNVPGSSGGISFGASSGPWFPALGFRGTGEMTVNFGASSFSGSIPSGFSSWNSLA